MLWEIGLHDSEVLALHTKNLQTWGRPRRKDPTEVTIGLWNPNEYVYTLKYSGVTSIDFSFNWRSKMYTGFDGQDHYFDEDQGGIHTWLYDELTSFNDSYLEHEIEFASGARLVLLFKRLACTRSVAKRRYAEAQRNRGKIR